MPSKMQHELNKLRGKTLIKEEKYTDTIAELKEKIIILEKEVLILDEEKIKHLSKINKIKTLSKNAYQRATEQHDKQRHKHRIRNISLNIPYVYNTANDYQGYRFDDTVKEEAAYRFKIPKDFISIHRIDMYWMKNGFEAAEKYWVCDQTLYYDRDGIGGFNNHNDIANTVITCPASEVLNVNTQILNNDLFNNVQIDDIISFYIERDPAHGSDDAIGDIALMTIEILYEADM